MALRVLIKIILILIITSNLYAGDLYVNWKYAGGDSDGTIGKPYLTLAAAVAYMKATDSNPPTELWTINIKGTAAAGSDGVALDMTDYADWYTEHFYNNDTTINGTATYPITVQGWGDSPPIFTMSEALPTSGWVDDSGLMAERWYLDVSSNNWNGGVNGTASGYMLVENFTPSTADLTDFYNVEASQVLTTVDNRGEFTATQIDQIIQRIYMIDKDGGNPNTNGKVYYFSPIKTLNSPAFQFAASNIWGKNLDYWIFDNLDFRLSGNTAIYMGGRGSIIRNTDIAFAGNKAITIECTEEDVLGMTVEYNSLHHIKGYCPSCGDTLQFNCSYGLVRRNKIYDGGLAGIIVTGNNNIIEYNEVYDMAGSGIMPEQVLYPPGEAGGFLACYNNTFRYNFSHDNTGAGFENAGGNEITVHNNLIVNNSWPASYYGQIEESDTANQQGGIDPESDDAFTKDNKYYNNTIVFDAYHNDPIYNFQGIHLTTHDSAGTHVTYVKNNLIVSTAGVAGAWMLDFPVADQVESDNNLLRDATNWKAKWAGTDYSTLGTWQAAVTPNDAYSLDSNPLFVNIASDWTLQSGSPAIDNGIELGVNYRNALAITSDPADWVNTVDTVLQDNAWNIGAYGDSFGTVMKQITVGTNQITVGTNQIEIVE